MQILTHKYTLPLLLAATLASYWLFSNAPAIDLGVSGLFHTDSGFWGVNSAWLHYLRMTFWNLSLGLLLVCVIALSLAHDYRWPQRVLPIRSWNVILWGFLLGPGVLANLILKAFSGRPRPRETLDFGGDYLFRALGQWDGGCTFDCSFVSGEVSGTTAFCLACIILIQHHRARLGALVVRALYGFVAVSFGFVFAHRIITGGHFLSDSILGALLTALVMVFVANLWPKARA